MSEDSIIDDVFDDYESGIEEMAAEQEAHELDPAAQRQRLRGSIEALLFVSDEPVAAAKFAQILDIEPSEASTVLAELAVEYREAGRGFQLLEVAGGWRLYTHPAYHEVVERYVLSWDTRKLSQAALEALAVIAYSQPVTRQGVNAIRGVNSEGVISSLIEKGLVREAGRENAPGAPILYATTTTFLEKFGLKSVKDLPPLEDFAPDEETRTLIRDRLTGSDPATPEIDLDEMIEEAAELAESVERDMAPVDPEEVFSKMEQAADGQGDA